MRQMMLDSVQVSAHALARERARQQLGNSHAAAAIAQPRKDQSRMRPMTQKIADPATPVGPAVLIDRDVVHIAQLEPCLAQAVADRLGGEARPVLLAAKALLLGG